MEEIAILIGIGIESRMIGDHTLYFTKRREMIKCRKLTSSKYFEAFMMRGLASS